MRNRRNYTFEGYHPDDGLEDGRWELGPGRVQVWVPDVPVLHVVPDLDGDQEDIACPTCGVTATETCRTKNGHRTKDHPARETQRICSCGAELTWKRRVCDSCCSKPALQKRRLRDRRRLEAS